MDTRSTHILAEFRGCEIAALNDLDYIEAAMRSAAEAAGATVVNSSFHQFGPQGVSGVLVLAESHISVHTWPEHAYAATDIYVCGDNCFPQLAQDLLASSLGAADSEMMTIERGTQLGGSNEPGMRVLHHQQGNTAAASAKLGDESAQSQERIRRA